MELLTRPLTTETWPAFADLVERHGGVFGGCWCMGFHAEGVGRETTSEGNRAAKEARVAAGAAHAALVFCVEDETCVGWCQFGTPEELPRIKRRKAYDAEPAVPVADWRITCFFVDKAWRRRGVADRALGGALSQIAALGGGRVESFPEDTTGRRASAAWMFNASLGLFERHGFEQVRPLGKHHWLVARDVVAG